MSARPSPAILVLMFASLAGLGTMSQFFRSMIAVIAPELTAEFALSGKELSVTAGVYFMAHASMQLPMGLVMDRFGPRRTLSAMLVLAVLGSVLFATAASGRGLFVGMAFIGFGCSTIILGSIIVLARWLPVERFAVAYALVTAVSNTGTLLSSAPLAYAAQALGWRGAVLAAGAITAVFGLIAFLTVRDAPPGHAFLERRRESAAEMLAGLWEVLSDRRIWCVLAIPLVGYATMITIRGLWIGPYLHEVYGLDAAARGNVLLVMSVAIIVGSLAWAPLDRWFDTRKWIILPGGFATAGVLGLMAFLPRLPLFQFVALLVVFALVGSYYLLGATHVKSLFPDRLVGRAVTLAVVSTFIGVSIIQPLTGWIVDASTVEAYQGLGHPYRMVFAFQMVVLGVALMIYSASRDARPSRPAADP